MKVLIDNGQGFVDYTRYVVDGSLSVEDSVNVPTVCNFTLAATDNSFVVPKRSAYVKVISETYTGTTAAPGTVYVTGNVQGYFFPVSSGNGVYELTYPTNPATAVHSATGPSLLVTNNNGTVAWFNINPDGSTDGSFNPWPGALGQFAMAGLTTLYVSSAGTYYFSVYHQDGAIFAIDGATVISGPVNNNPVGQTRTPIGGYSFTGGLCQVAAANNGNLGGPGPTDQYSIYFPRPGYYPMEFGWATANNLVGVGHVQFFTVAPGQNPTQYTPGRVLATGFITGEPSRSYLGLNQSLTSFGKQQLAYAITVTSDEWLLNCNTVPYIPAFVNQTAGEILAGIADVLAPDFLNVNTFTGSGDLIPYYQYDSTQTWSDVAKYFGDALRYRYKVIDRALYFEPFAQTPLGVSYDETQGEKNIFPLQLTTGVVSVPPVNDCLVFGGTEPQANWENYFIGDGTTSQFRLLHQVFEGATAILVEDDWTEAEFQANLWNVFEFGAPVVGNGQIFTLFDDVSGSAAGSLIAESGSIVTTLGGVSGTYIIGVNGFEMGGALNLQHGEFEFTDTCYGIVGGIYYNTSPTEANCFAGFRLTTSGANLGQLLSVTHPGNVTASGAAGIIMQPLYLGQPVGPQVVSQINHTYLLQTWVGASAWNRYENVYRNLTGDAAYGGNMLAASGTISWVITDNNLGAYAALPIGTVPVQAEALVQPVITKYTLQQQNPPEFVTYAPLNNQQLNLSVQNTIVANPPEGSLYVYALTGASGLKLPVLPSALGSEIHYLMGFGQQNQTATVLTQNDTQFLAFYDDTIPGVGSRIRYQSWASGQSAARVTDPIAIANEAAISGDNGVRSAIMQNLQPQPRTSAECEAAAAAAILDREYPQFQGNYTIETLPKYVNLFNPSIYDYPRSGELLYINAPYRAVSGEYFIANTVSIQVTEPREEVLEISVDYGPDLYLERTLANFTQRLDLTNQVVTPQETAPPPDLIHIDQVGNAFLDDLQDAKITSIDNAFTGNTISIDLGIIPVTGCEIRRADFNWGIPDNNLISTQTTRTFSLTRSSRDQVWYLRQVNGGTFSRFSKALRVAYPFIPSAPTLLSYNATQLVFDLSGYVNDIYGLEIRVPAVSGTVYVIPQGPAENVGQLTRVVLPNTGMVPPVNVGDSYAVYFPPTGEAFSFQKGDIVYFAPISGISPSSKDFYPTFRLIVAKGTETNAGQSGTGPVKSVNQVPTSQGTLESIMVQAAAAGPNATAGTIIWVYYNRSEPRFGGPDMNLSSALIAAQTAGYTLNITFENLGAPFTAFNGTPYPVVAASNWNSWITPPGGDHNWFYLGVDVGGTPGVLNTGFTIPQGTSATYQWSYSVSATVPTYDWFSWYDYGFGPNSVTASNGTEPVATCQLLQRGSFWEVSNGSIDHLGNATLTTTTNHGLTAGDVIITSVGNIPPGPEGAVFNAQGGQWQITNVPAANEVSFAMGAQYGGNVGNYAVTGIIAQMPTNFIGGAAGDVIVQKPVFAPSDLVIDVTQPDIAGILGVLEAQTPNGRITGLTAYFFNLKWDYSEPTVIPSFAAPSLSGIIIDPISNSINWGIAQGIPNGYRANVVDAATTLSRNKFTVNHPNNPVLLKQFQMSALDSPFPCVITITPFDALGDGVPSVISWPGFNSGQGTTSQNGSLTVVAEYPLTGGYFPGNIMEIGAPYFTGDSGFGGQAGSVPPPPAGSAAAGEFLSASGIWAPPTFPAQPYDLVVGLTGKPPANLTLPIETFPRIVSFLGNWLGSKGSDQINPTGTATYTIQKNGSTVGTVAISTGGVFTFSSTGGNPVTFNIGDVFTLITPNPQDGTLSGVTMTFVGSRSS